MQFILQLRNKEQFYPETTQSRFKPNRLLFSICFCSQIKGFLYTKYHLKHSQRNPCTTWLFFFKRSKCFPYCGTLNGCRKCCHSTLLSKLPEWGFGSGGCQCGRFQHSTDPAQVSSRWGRLQESPPSLYSPASNEHCFSPPALHSTHSRSYGQALAWLEFDVLLNWPFNCCWPPAENQTPCQLNTRGGRDKTKDET